MKPIWKKPHGDGTEDELWLGVPSWDPENREGKLSIKFAYRKDGRIPRTAPEVPEDIAVDMVVMLSEHGRLGPEALNKLRSVLREKEMMQNYVIFVDEMKDSSQLNSSPSYQIALRPFNGPQGGGPMATKRYTTQQAFIADLQEYLGYTDSAVRRFFAATDKHQTLTCPLSHDVAAYLGWLPEYNQH
jgi:hypothetical protein